MKNRILFLLLCFSPVHFLAGQDFKWGGTIGGWSSDYVSIPTVDMDGNVITVGYFNQDVDFDPGPGVYTLSGHSTISSEDIYIQKVDSLGNFLWAKMIGSRLIERASAVATDHNGNIYITGMFEGLVDFDPNSGVTQIEGSQNGDIFLLKLDSNGNFLWVKVATMPNWSYNTGLALTIDSEGDILFSGTFGQAGITFDPGSGNDTLYGSGGNDNDIFLMKVDRNGNYKWGKSMGGSTYAEANRIGLDAADNIYLAGAFEGTVDFDPGPDTVNLSSNSQWSNYFILKLNASGDFQWVRQLGHSTMFIDKFTQPAFAVSKTSGVVLGGYTNVNLDLDPGPDSLYLASSGTSEPMSFLIKLDPQGDLSWGKGFYGNRTLRPYPEAQIKGVCMDASDNLYLTGEFHGHIDFDPSPGEVILTSPDQTMFQESDGFVVSLDSKGNLVWIRHIEGDGEVVGTNIVFNDDNNLMYCYGYYRDTIDVDPGPGQQKYKAELNEDIFLMCLSEDLSVGIDQPYIQKISIGPNPTQGLVKLNLPNDLNSGMVLIFDKMGKEVIRKNLTNNILDLSALPSGTYDLIIMEKSDPKYRSSVVVKH